MLLDIENGSVGGALVRTSVAHAPKLLAEERIHLPVRGPRTHEHLVQKMGTALESVAQHLSHVAARMRNHPQTTALGTVERAVVFVSAPWGVPDLVAGNPTFNADVLSRVGHATEGYFGLPFTHHAGASAALHSARTLLPYDDSYLLCIPSGELVELLSVEQGTVRSYATLPVGSHTLLRTLQSHAGLTEAEARSALRLNPAHLAEALRAAHEHVADEFVPAAKDLGWGSHSRVYVLSHDGDWLARALSSTQAAALFGQGSTVKHLHGAHAAPHLSQYAHTPDWGLASGALFVDAHYR